MAGLGFGLRTGLLWTTACDSAFLPGKLGWMDTQQFEWPNEDAHDEVRETYSGHQDSAHYNVCVHAVWLVSRLVQI